MSKKRVPLICGGHSRPVPHLSFSPDIEDGLFMVSGCLDGNAMLRYGVSGDWIGTFVGHKGAVWSSRINTTATRVLTGSADFSLKYWDAITGKEISSIDHKHVVKAVDFSPDETKCLSAGLDKKVKLWDLETTEPIIELQEGHKRGISTALWLNETTILSGGGESGIRVWDIRSSEVVKVMDTPKEISIKSLEVAGEGSAPILACAAGKSAIFFSTENFDIIKQYTYSGDINWVSMHPSGRDKFAVACVDGFKVMIYEYESGAELEKHGGHHGPPHCVRWAPNGAYFASGSDDGTIRLWRDEEVVKQEQDILREKERLREEQKAEEIRIKQEEQKKEKEEKEKVEEKEEENTDIGDSVEKESVGDEVISSPVEEKNDDKEIDNDDGVICDNDITIEDTDENGDSTS